MTRTNKFLLTWAALATVIAFILFHVKGCGERNKIIAGYQMTTSVKEIIDTMRFEKEVVYKPTIIRITEPSDTFILSLPLDSAYCDSLARLFYTLKEYNDTMKGDSLDIINRIWVSKNDLDSIKSKVIVRVPYVKTIETTIITPIPKTPWKFYIGGVVGINGLGFVGGPEVTLTDRNRMLYKAGIDFSTFTTPVYRFGFGVKLSFPKKK